LHHVVFRLAGKSEYQIAVDIGKTDAAREGEYFIKLVAVRRASQRGARRVVQRLRIERNAADAALRQCGKLFGIERVAAASLKGQLRRVRRTAAGLAQKPFDLARGKNARRSPPM
jgi:hypothetical protein